MQDLKLLQTIANMTQSNIFIIGINHHTAPMAVRERLSFSQEDLEYALTQCTLQPDIDECIIVSTCNRTEVITVGGSIIQLTHWLASYHHADVALIENHCYSYQGDHAVHHLLRVACGLDSMLVGETEILGQLKKAFYFSQEHLHTKAVLSRLMPRLFAIAKKVRSETLTGMGALSLTYATICLAKQHFPNICDIKATFVGAGHMIQNILIHFHKQGLKDPVIANRSLDTAKNLAHQFGGHAIPIGEISSHIDSCQLLISATSSPLPIIGKGLIERTHQSTQQQPMVIIDMALPRDIEPEVRSIPGIQLYDLDDLKTAIKHSWNNRIAASERAEAIIDIQANILKQDLAIAQHSDIIRQFRNQIYQLRDNEISSMLHAIKNGNNPKEIIDKHIRQLTNRILHHPTKQLRQAAAARNMELLNLATTLLTDLPQYSKTDTSG